MARLGGPSAYKSIHCGMYFVFEQNSVNPIASLSMNSLKLILCVTLHLDPLGCKLFVKSYTYGLVKLW